MTHVPDRAIYSLSDNEQTKCDKYCMSKWDELMDESPEYQIELLIEIIGMGKFAEWCLENEHFVKKINEYFVRLYDEHTN